MLFVDDEPAILSGIEHLLHKERKRWQMEFADGPTAALAKLRAGRFDVVVSDMRMPVMDGATLLNLIRDESPGTARIMLSGHAEREAITRALPALHQLLSKPCDVTTLRGAIERGLGMPSETYGDSMRSIVGRFDKLPSPTDVYDEFSRAVQAPSTTTSEIIAIVERDPGLVAKVMQLVNSAYFGSGKKTSSIPQAITLLGIETLRHLWATGTVFSPVEADGFSVQTIAEFQREAWRAAQLVRRLVPEQDADEVYTATLLHDVGCVVLMLGMAERYREVLERPRDAATSLDVIEREALGVTHAQVGASLLRLWGLPAPISELVLHHHDPGSAPAELRMRAAAIHVAEALSHEHHHELDIESLERAGATAILPQWRAIAQG